MQIATPSKPKMNEIEVLEDLLKDDMFLRTWPTFKHYFSDWGRLAEEVGADDAQWAPTELIFEFYAAKVDVAEGIGLVEKYRGAEESR